MKYAQHTQVSSERSRGEIEQVLMRYGATGFQYGWMGERAMIQFVMNRKVIQFQLPLPNKDAEEFQCKVDGRSNSLKKRSPEAVLAVWEQSCRQRWRALLLAIKAKLEAVECQITTFEQEFMAHIVMPGTRRTIGDEVLPQIEKAYETGKTPTLALPWK